MTRTPTPAAIAFVYGTLTDRDRVERVLGEFGERDAAYGFRGRATLEGFHRVDGEYPTLAPGGAVEGRLLAVDESGLAALDAYEGVPRGLYVRVAVPLVGSDDPFGVDSVETYVGDPARLGVADRVDWPDGPSFADRVRAYVATADPAARPIE